MTTEQTPSGGGDCEMLLKGKRLVSELRSVSRRFLSCFTDFSSNLLKMCTFGWKLGLASMGL